MKSLIFSSSTLQQDEYRLYRQLFDIIYSSLPKPDLYVYLHKTVDNLINNIKLRGREYEQNISFEYLKSIENGYFTFFKQQKDLKILIIDTNNIDFVNNDKDYRMLVNTIFDENYDKGINRIVF
jgi:deoxyadenosine/deoxycytidine kinase